MCDYEKKYSNYNELLKERLSEYRYIHSVNVARRAFELAKIYDENCEKAYLAGLLHDITKEDDYETQEKYIAIYGMTLTSLEKSSKSVYHQISGAGYIKGVLGIDDEQVLSAVRYHTTGHSDMTTLEMIVFLADLTSEERSYNDVDTVRSLSEKSLLDAMQYSLSFVISDLAKKYRPIYPDTLYCYNWVIEKIKKENENL